MRLPLAVIHALGLRSLFAGLLGRLAVLLSAPRTAPESFSPCPGVAVASQGVAVSSSRGA